ncbi:MAG: helix-turn-helix domain-containing protein [Mariniphaga sp.]|nr:helix-turn-helix domain-containing protein [Mariniphaga sp.]
MDPLHEKIRRLRIEKHITQVEIASAAKLSRSAYIMFEKGESETLSIKAGKGIAKTLDISFVELFEIENSGLESLNFQIEIKKLEKKIEDYEKRIADQDYLIEVLKNELNELKASLTWEGIEWLLDELVNLELKNKNTNDKSLDSEILQYETELIKQLEVSLEKQILSEEELFNLFSHSYPLRDFLLEENISKPEFAKKLADYINRFVKIEKQKIEKLYNNGLYNPWDYDILKKHENKVRRKNKF